MLVGWLGLRCGVRGLWLCVDRLFDGFYLQGSLICFVLDCFEFFLGWMVVLEWLRCILWLVGL